MRRNITFIRLLGIYINPVQDEIPDGCAIATYDHPRWNNFTSSVYGTNNFGFNNIPGGGRGSSGKFSNIGVDSRLWSSTPDGDYSAYFKGLWWGTNSLFSYSGQKHFGNSVIACKNYSGVLKDGEILEDAYTDGDNNTYDAVRIGNLLWTVENLKTTKYQNGDAISNVTDNATWAALTTGAYCWYNNDYSTYGQYYGALYNWYAVNNGLVSGNGWRVPTTDDMNALINHLIDNYDDITSSNIARYLKSCRQVKHPLA